jgi:glycosyltransferase involved in cell wall biosynthesis
MRIAQVAPLFESVPPALYGGTERVVSYLTEELVRLGHEVTLFASGDSQTTAALVAACPAALWRDPDVRETLPQHVRLLELVFQQASRFEIIHFHVDYLHFPLIRRQRCATVTTMHGLLHAHDVKAFFEEYDDVPLVSISDNQRVAVPSAAWQATVYHGLPRALFRPAKAPGGYLAFIGHVARKGRRSRDRDRAAGECAADYCRQDLS